MAKGGVTMEWLMEAAIDPRATISLARMTLAGGVTSELHRHSNCAETLHLVSGDISQRIGEDWIRMKAGETCLIPENTSHQTHNMGEDIAEMMLTYSAGARDYIKS